MNAQSKFENSKSTAKPEADYSECMWLRIEEGLEKLEAAARAEPDPNRRDHIFNVLAEARCI